MVAAKVVVDLEAEILKLDRRLARESFRDFVRLVKPAYEIAWFHDVLITRMQQLADGSTSGGRHRLGLALPPGHAKSEYALLYAAWRIGCDPDANILFVTYKQKFAEAQLERLKKIVRSDEYVRLFGRRINPKRVVSDVKRAKANNSTEFGVVGGEGVVRCTGFDGGITGGRYDDIIIDDPFKGHDDSSSKTVRDKRWKTYQLEILSRYRPDRDGLRILMLFTRWHLDDLTGRCQRDEAGDWMWVSIPALREGVNDDAEIEALDPRAEGEALWPNAIKAEQLAKRRIADPEGFQCIYQQSPVPDGGATYKASWWHRWEALPDLTGATWVQSWDFRGGAATDRGSYAVGMLWVRPEGSARSYLVDMVRGRWGVEETHAQFAQAQEREGWRRALPILVEAKADGVGILGLHSATVPGMQAVKPHSNKLTRARNIVPLVSAGNISLPAFTPWIGELLAELTTFPVAANDDQVDALTQAVDYLYAVSEIDQTPEEQAADTWGALAL